MTEELVLTVDALARVNFAGAQNGVALLRELRLENRAAAPLTDLTVTLTSEPPVFRPKTWRIDRIAANGELNLKDLHTPLDIRPLAGLNEAELGELRVVVDGANRRIADKRIGLELLARDEWGGIEEMPQILAAFVAPNDAAVADLLKQASALLERSGHDGALNGYQSGDPQRAWLLAGALWSAATGLGLSYAQPPASFETAGQKIRSPSRIRSEGLATCLDSTLLLAAAFEAVGLHSVVLFSEGHAWVGVWLLPTDFGHTTEVDVVTVRKATQAGEFVPIETTLLTQRPAGGLERAVQEGLRRLAEERESEFIMAVDIARARAARIRPLASHAVTNDDAAAPAATATAVLPQPLRPESLPAETIENIPTTPAGRIQRWQSKLLDLSLRNRLLNFRSTKQTLSFLCPWVGQLEDALAKGRRFKVLALRDEDPVGGRPVSPEERHRIEEASAEKAFANGQLAAPLSADDMNRRLVALYRRAKSDLQEGGANTLFLTAGILRWKKKADDSRVYRAPLLLIPVKLVRRSVRSGFSIRHHEDDVRFNLTLLEFLKQDFDLKVPELEGELPRDESGVDVPKVLRIMQRKVRDVPSFEVVDELALSTFSFAKYLMWKDLVERTDRLRENRLVKYLVDDAGVPFGGNGQDAIEPAKLDDHLDPDDILTPLPADSSQLAAVVAAFRGRDFVLIGPPGTGKSQTITNIISQCLANGQTILFVAEKAAALDVVHRRLVAHGLGDAVLELHSNKSDRKSVLAQLGSSWDRTATHQAPDWLKTTGALKITRDSLNAYVEALHRKGSQGFSVFDAIGWIAGAGDGIEIPYPSKDAHDEESFERLADIAGKLEQAHAVVRDRPQLSMVAATDWSNAWQSSFLKVAGTLQEATRALLKAMIEASRQVGLGVDPRGLAEQQALMDALVARIGAEALDVSAVPDVPATTLHAHAETFAADLAALETAQQTAAAAYAEETVRRLPLARLDAAWRETNTKFWPMSALARRRTRKLLQTYTESGVADPARDLSALLVMQDKLPALDANPIAALAGAGRNITRARAMIEQAVELRDALHQAREIAEDNDRLAAAGAELAAGVGDNLRQVLEAYVTAGRSFAQAATAFEDTDGQLPEIPALAAQRDHRPMSTPSADGQHPGGATLAAIIEGLDTIVDNRAHILDWTRWLQVREAALSAGLAPLVEALENGRLEAPAGVEFRRGYVRWWLPRALDASEQLRLFAHWEHEDRIAAFRELIAEAETLAPREVMRRIWHDLPARDAVARKSELGQLRHQLGLKRPSMPIRKLFASMPEAFPKLAPCVLMSPLSIAQYLPAGQATFDVVIFDEASQITTWDAIGAIARGRQTIVVGDPKQLPPTNFFGRAEKDDDDLEDIERDMPSILDEVCAAGIPEHRLDWHYRSRDEALIAFSNHHYYNDSLVTFPAPATDSQAVRFHKIEGTYARGGARTNQREAKAIVAMIRRRLTAWLDVPEDDRYTLGVITFNMQQQALIQDLLDEVRRGDPRLEWFFDDDRVEPVIVKNLESIQGDERDVMLFSITFGEDVAGKLSMNFGAVNNDGGEKRLNVAITRARRELHIFASITAEQINLARTRARGVRDLKTFLDYAARGAVALPARQEGSLGAAENPFEASVADAFRSKGWEVRTQIGVSGFRVDLGVVNPDVGGAFLAGIECDGARYHSSATARDRDKVRQSVLEGLGWKILRIWSTDWFRHPNAVTARLHDELEDLLAADRAVRAAAAAIEDPTDDAVAQIDAPADERSHLAPADRRVPALHGSDARESPGPERLASQHATRPTMPLANGGGKASGGEGLASRHATHPSMPPAEQDSPRPRDPLLDLSADRFFETSYTPVLLALIDEILETEGPMPVKRLARFVALSHGWQRTGRRIVDRVAQNLPGAGLHVEFGIPFLWPPNTHADRIAFRGLDGRSIEEVSRSEIAWVIDRNARAIRNAEDPTSELARFLGIGRTGKKVRAYLEKCLAWQATTAWSAMDEEG